MVIKIRYIFKAILQILDRELKPKLKINAFKKVKIGICYPFLKLFRIKQYAEKQYHITL
jgi:hypothetical protein